MKTLIKIAGVLLILAGCQNAEKPSIVPAIVPAAQKTTEVKKMPLNIIGAVEPIYILPMKSAFEARIDTGATTSSLDVTELNEFERDGEKWVSFKVKNRRSGEVHTFEKPILKSVKIKRIEDKEDRIKVYMPVSFGGQKFVSEFTLANREKFEYQVLIGRNILSGRAIVDTSLSHTLK
jgi:hypothetical protein